MLKLLWLMNGSLNCDRDDQALVGPLGLTVINVVKGLPVDVLLAIHHGLMEMMCNETYVRLVAVFDMVLS
jgi:hypothetical protein